MDRSTPTEFDFSDEDTPNPVVSVPANLDQLANEIADLIDAVAQPTLLSPMEFIDEFIRTEVMRSTIDENLKTRFTSTTKIKVEYHEHYILTAADWLGPHNKVPTPPKILTFELQEIVTDFYRHGLNNAGSLRILWPDAFPADLRQLFDKVNLQERYEKQVKDYFNRRHVKDLSMLLMQNDLEGIVRHYLEGNSATMPMRETATAFLKNKIKPQLVQFNMTTKVKLERAVFLPVPSTIADNKTQGLLVFLGNEEKQQSVYEVPQDIKLLREFIDGNAELRKRILERVPLYYQLKTKKKEVEPRSLLFSVHIDRPLWVPPITFEASPDILGDLFDLSYECLLSDIDTLVSTDAERLNDALLEFGGYMLSALALGATLPFSASLVAARIVAAFLLGLASAATDAVRGHLADLPETSAELYRAAFIAALSEIIAPLVHKMAGKTLSALSRTKLARKLKVIMNGRQRPSTATPYLIDALAQSRNSAKMRSLELKLTAHFQKGPQVAQHWLDKRGRLLQQFIDPHEVTIYRGFVFRGDMRDPKLIFKEGFKLRTSAADLQKDIHQATGVRGGFGGGRDALDLDGRGISTSVFYDKNHVGAYTYGGAKGGYTYLVDARKLDGYHLYANDFAARHPGGPKLTLSPVEINYATDIPPSAIIGAYDKNGVFIPNPKGIRTTARINQGQIERDLARRTFSRAAVKETVKTETTLGIDATLQLFFGSPRSAV